MNMTQIKKALRRLSDEGARDAEKKLILAVPFKRGHGADMADVIGYVAENRGESVREVKKNAKGAVVGALVRADNLARYYVMDADLALLFTSDGELYGYEHTSNVVNVRPEELALGKAAVVDGNGEMFTDLDACVDAILYGSSGRGGPWFEHRR